MNNNDNEIKFVKGRSNDSEVVIDLFKKGRYYDAFYKLKRLEPKEQIKFLPIVAETYAKLNKTDYEADALLKLLMNSDEMQNGSAFDKRVIALRLSEYYSYKGEKLQRLSFLYDESSKIKNGAKSLNKSSLTENLIKFPARDKSKNEEGIIKFVTNDCKIYKKSNLSVDYGAYICERATALAMAGKYSDAINVLAQINKDSPSYLDSRNILIAVYIDSGQILEASEVAIEILKGRPNEFIVLFAINTALNMSINCDNIFQALMSIEGKTGAQCSVLRANAFGNCGEFEKAIKILDMLDQSESYIIDVLRVKAICYAGLSDKENQENILKQIVTIYPKDLKSRCILSKMEKGEDIDTQALGLDKSSEFLADDFKNFYENELSKLASERLSEEEAEYYYDLCLKFGSDGVLINCTDEFLKCKRYMNIICNSLVSLNVNDFKKLIIIERMVVSAKEIECFSLIKGIMKKLSLTSLKFIIEQFKENVVDSLVNSSEERVELEDLINGAYAKAFALSLLFDIDGAEISKRVGALLLYYITHKSSDISDVLKIFENPRKIAFSACILMSPQVAKNPHIKKYLGLKNAEVDEIINILRQTGFRDK